MIWCVGDARWCREKRQSESSGSDKWEPLTCTWKVLSQCYCSDASPLIEFLLSLARIGDCKTHLPWQRVNSPSRTHSAWRTFPLQAFLNLYSSRLARSNRRTLSASGRPSSHTKVKRSIFIFMNRQALPCYN